MEVNRILVGLDISIHAPREGCDNSIIQRFAQSRISIHAPREGCDGSNGTNYITDVVISIHAPREGCDFMEVNGIFVALDISIHAPREGCDSKLY